LGIWFTVRTSGIGNAITGVFNAVKNQVTSCTAGDCGG